MKLSDICVEVERHCEPYLLTEIRGAGRHVVVTLEHVGDDQVTAQSRFAVDAMELQLVEGMAWHDAIAVHTKRAVADLDRFLRRDAIAAAPDDRHPVT